MHVAKALLTLAAFSLALAFSAPAARADGDDVISIGVYLPLSGQNAFGGQLELDGIRLAQRAFPTVLGRNVRLLVVDNKSDRVEAGGAVKRLIESEHVTAVIGTYGSSLAIAGGEAAEKGRTPMVGTSCTNPLVTMGRKYCFRVCYIDPFQGAAAATYVVKNLGLRKAGILMDTTNDYAVGLSSFFERSFTKLGGEIVSKQTYRSGDRDFTAQLAELDRSRPDIVFMPAYFAEGAVILKQARELGVTCRLMGADAMDNPDAVRTAGAAVEGFLHTTFPYDVSMPAMSDEARTFTDAWRAAFPGREPNVNAALGYDAYCVVIDAIARAGSAGTEAVTEALARTSGLPTVLGRLTINSMHDAEMPVGIIEYRNGARVYVTEVLPDQGGE